jgi:hypothetical protein
MTDSYQFADKHKWFDWPKWGLALGSEERYWPRWYERRAYFKGLRDAARIVDNVRWQPIKDHIAAVEAAHGDIATMDTGNGPAPYRNGWRRGGRVAVKAIHAYMLNRFNLKPDDRSGLE